MREQNRRVCLGRTYASGTVDNNRLKQPAVFGRARARCLAFASSQTYNKAPTGVEAGWHLAGMGWINPLC